jgi:hypothetical protein
MADAWVRIVDVNAREIVLEVVNSARRNRRKLKGTFASVHLNNLGGAITTETIGDLFIARIAIPTVAALAVEVGS